ncbi:MDR family MFS transporter [Caldalkalibacillus mannanilyticus]|uniref:MDR family MFS transporter n=1 Tax=Caldalkalibacillus mannanilyticus TaxID=1418 RepID=UPI0004684210|nr:MDR family MFS transporter [Caldalkalibacillus mannanilyticus]
MVSEDSNRKLVIAGLLLGILMAAMDNTIVATAMGTIVSDLGGFDRFVWVTAAYMVAVMAGMPIYGKLSDMYGRKRFFVFGLSAFLFGSVLCGMAQTMEQLIIFRAIQGIGGGALLPIAFTIVFDLFPPQNRGKMTGLLGAVFGTASVLGPLLGALITDLISWHWIFYINVPIGVLALFFIVRYYKETHEHSKHKIDWSGAITLIISVVSLMFALELGGRAYAWDSIQIISLFSIFTVFLVLFFLVERKVDEPIISFWMFKNRLYATSQIIAFLYGGTFIILAVFVPIFVQAVGGGSATNAGFVLTPMMLGSVVGSMIGGMSQTKTSFRNLMIVSVIFFFLGMFLLSGMSQDTARGLLIFYMVIAGFGVGFSFSLLPSASIHHIEPRFRGSANSTNAFIRSLGMTIGVTIFGAIQNKVFNNNIQAFENVQDLYDASGAPLIDLKEPQQIFQPDQRALLPDTIVDQIAAAIASSITYTFLLALIPISLAAITILFMGNTRVEVSKEQKITNKA